LKNIEATLMLGYIRTAWDHIHRMGHPTLRFTETGCPKAAEHGRDYYGQDTTISLFLHISDKSI